MALTSAGALDLAKLVNGETVAKFQYLGVGSDATAFSIAQTQLVSAYADGRKLATTVRASAIITYTATYGVDDAEGAWEEWGLFNNASVGSGTMLGRKVESLGTKPVGTQSWTFETTVTWAAA